jgi:hypothetical protein
MMYPSRRADDPHPESACADTDAAYAGHTLCDVEVIRAAVHDLVEGLAPGELHALWQVILVVWQDIEHTGPRS